MKISLVITILNEANTIEQLLDSIHDQSRQPDETIIVDGGSTDGTGAAISGWKKTHGVFAKTVRLLHKKGNRSVSRNHGIVKARHEWIAITDAGCVLSKDWLKQLENAAQQTTALAPKKSKRSDSARHKNIVVAGYYQGQAESSFQKAVVPYALVMPDRVNAQEFLPATRSMLMTKSVWTAVGGFDETLSDNEDYAFARNIRELKKKNQASMVFARNAIVSWLPPSNLFRFMNMIFRFARGDMAAGIIRPKVTLIFLRYLLWLATAGVLALSSYSSLISWQVVLLTYGLLGSLGMYIFWSIQKNKKYVADSWPWLPVLQVTSDLAVMMGSVIGWLRAKEWRPFVMVFVIAASLYTVGVFHIGSAIWGDSHYYYAYTRSLVMDYNLDFANEAFRGDFGFPNPPKVSAIAQRVVNQFSPGAPLLWIPAFLAGQLLSIVASAAGFPIAIDGYSLLTQLTVGVSTVGFSVSGLWLMYKGLCYNFSKQVSLATSFVLLLTTQLLFYTAIDPFNSHSASFLVSSGIFWMMSKLQQQDWLNTIGLVWLGSLLGLLGLIRNQNVLLVIPIMVWLWLRKSNHQRLANNIVALILAAGLIVSIQLWFTYHLFGQLGSGYTLDGQVVQWLQPDFLRVLFSKGNGLFRFAPISAVALVGLISLIKQRHVLAAIGLTFFLFELYVIASWVPEIVGGPYGSRMFTATLPWLSMGLAVVIKQLMLLKSKRPIIWLASLVSIAGLVFNNLYHTIVMLIRW